VGLGLGLAVIDRYAMYLLSVRGWSTEVVSGSVLCTGQNQVQVEPGPGECCKCVPVVTSTSSLHILLCHWHFLRLIIVAMVRRGELLTGNVLEHSPGLSNDHTLSYRHR